MIKKIGTMARYGGPVLVDRIITDSVTMGVGYSVKSASGFAALTTAGDAVLGHVVNIVASNGLAPALDGTFLGNLGSTYAVAADNESDAQVRVVVDVDKNSIYEAELDAAPGTTTNSDLADFRFDVADKDTLDESTVTASSAQYHSHGVGRYDTTKVDVSIYESQLFG